MEPTAAQTTAPASPPETGERWTDTSDSIERTDAWRTPAAPAAPVETLSATTQPGMITTDLPEVVDLAPPEEPAVPVIPEDDGLSLSKFGGAMVGFVLFAALLIGGIIWLAITLFSDGTDTATQDDSTPTTAVEEVDEPDAVDSSDAGSSDGSEVVGAALISVFDVREGDCIVGDITGQILEVERVDCSEEHQFEVYQEALIDNSIVEYDEPAISAFSENVCRTSLAETIPADDDRGISFKFLQPTRDSWNEPDNPDRVVTCLLFDDDAPLIGRASDEQ